MIPPMECNHYPPKEKGYMNMKPTVKIVTLIILLLGTLVGCMADGQQAVAKTTSSKETQPSLPCTEGCSQPSVTMPSMTQPPVSEPPVTQPPATEPPETEPPETEPPVTEPPATEPPHVHAYQTAVKKPTCTEGGYTTYTCSCGDSYQGDYTNAKGHVYVDTVVEPTTTQQGYTKHACACGHSYTDSYVDPIEAYTDAELAVAIIHYINEYRKADGVAELIPQPIMGKIAKIRSEQLLTDYKHDTLALRKICAEFQYGKYIDMTQYGYDSSYNYYDARLAEAIGHFAAIEMPLEVRAQRIAMAFRNSSAHWSYLGSDSQTYIAVGCSRDQYDWYVCIFVSDVTYG